MARTEERLMAHSQRSYELGRLRRTVKDSWVVALIVTVGFLRHSDVLLTAVAAALLFIATTFFSWRGEGWSRAIWPGFAAGAVPLVVPSLAPAKSVCWIAGSCWPVCSLLCPLSGLVAGLALGALASRQDGGKLAMLVGSTFVAGLTGAIGCALAGAMGIAGMLVGGCLGFVPVYLGVKIARLHA
jgi:hypothetical protein